MPIPQGNAAIGYDQRELVARCLKHTLGDRLVGNLIPLNERDAMERLAERLERPGPPLVSTADVEELLDLIRSLQRMQAGDVLDHPWGYVRRVFGGFLMASPGRAEAPSNRQNDDALALAHHMYEYHLCSRGLAPQF